jgi:hypothetical protein
MTKKQKQLTKKFGMPTEFAKAIWKAHAYMAITTREAYLAIYKYSNEWLEAGIPRKTFWLRRK